MGSSSWQLRSPWPWGKSKQLLTTVSSTPVEDQDQSQSADRSRNWRETPEESDPGRSSDKLSEGAGGEEAEGEEEVCRPVVLLAGGNAAALGLGSLRLGHRSL